MQFFFYGTLLDGSDNPVAREVHRLLEPVGAAQVRGSLFGVPDADGWFPALVAGEGVVHGKLYRSRGQFGAGDLVRLDAYEDFDPAAPAASLYLRRTCEVLTQEGRAVQAEVYCFNQPLPAGSIPIPLGDFRAWLAETGLAQFTGLREGQGN